MALTIDDARTLLQLLEEPPLRAQLRWLVVTEELLALSAQFERFTETVMQLAEAQRRTEERVEQLAEAQRRTEERVEQLAEAQRRTEERLERLEATVQALAEAQRRTEERVEQLAEAQRRTEERLGRLEATVQALAEAQRRTEERVEQLAEAQWRTEADLRELIVETRRLADWQRGEAGLREGERYERLILKRAPLLFMDGQGGFTDQPFVQQRLSRLLKSLPDMAVLTDDENPLLADLVWWKDDQFLVVEVSRQVDSHDVVRAARRAATLQRTGVQAVGMVIGEEWAGVESREQAETRAIQWKVGNDLSEGFLVFRRLTA